MPDQKAFLTLCARGQLILSQPAIAGPLVHRLEHVGQRWQVHLDAYCIMPDHLHLIVALGGPGGDLQKWLRYAKRETGKLLAPAGSWQRSYWDRHARSDREVEVAALYLLNNPVRRGLCESWRDWPYSWSRWHPKA